MALEEERDIVSIESRAPLLLSGIEIFVLAGASESLMSGDGTGRQ